MNSTPPLSTYNCFEILSNICDSETPLPDVQTTEETLPPATTPFPVLTPKVRKLKWQKTLPKVLMIAATEEISTSLRLKVEIETTDTAERKSVTALLDSGSTGECINRDYAKSCWFNLVKLEQLIPVYNVDGTPNKAGSITEVVSLILRYKNHSERTTFCVTNLGKQKLILGHSWLRKNNPEIDWGMGNVKMSQCPPGSCSGCRDEL